MFDIVLSNRLYFKQKWRVAEDIAEGIVEDIATIFQNNTAPAAIATVGVSIIGLTALSPPPLAMFPPQGLPQPGAGGLSGGGSAGGGGTVPTVALQVLLENYKSTR